VPLVRAEISSGDDHAQLSNSIHAIYNRHDFINSPSIYNMARCIATQENLRQHKPHRDLESIVMSSESLS
jgi:hypothetical protein